MFALGAYVYMLCTDPERFVTTFITYESIGPSGFRQVLVTSVRVAKALVKFNFVSGIIFMHRKIYHAGLLLLSYMAEAIISAGFDRSGHKR